MRTSSLSTTTRMQQISGNPTIDLDGPKIGYSTRLVTIISAEYGSVYNQVFQEGTLEFTGRRRAVPGDQGLHDCRRHNRARTDRLHGRFHGHPVCGGRSDVSCARFGRRVQFFDDTSRRAELKVVALFSRATTASIMLSTSDSRNAARHGYEHGERQSALGGFCRKQLAKAQSPISWFTIPWEFPFAYA